MPRRWEQPLTVFGDLHDVAEQGAVAVEGLGPGEVDGPFLQGAEGGRGALGGVGELPGQGGLGRGRLGRGHSPARGVPVGMSVCVGGSHRTRRWALRESLPPAETTLQV